MSAIEAVTLLVECGSILQNDMMNLVGLGRSVHIRGSGLTVKPLGQLCSLHRDQLLARLFDELGIHVA